MLQNISDFTNGYNQANPVAPLIMPEDFELKIIEKVKKGDAQAFEYLVKKYEKPLFVVVGALLRYSYATPDLVQDVFLTVYANLGSFDPLKGRFSSWLFTIARNKCLNEINRKKETHAPRQMENVRTPVTPDAALLEKEAFATLDRALEQLPFELKSVFVLAEFEGLGYAEIAEIEDAPIGTVKSRLARARAKIRSVLKPYKG